MAEQKPKVAKFDGDEWEFVFPASIEKTYEEYFEGVELLGENDAAAEKIFKKLIQKHPYHIDAYNHLSLAFKNQKKLFESFLTAEKAYLLGKLCLPKEFKMGKSKLPWGILDNRPFLRSCQILGMEYQDKKQYQEAIYYYTEALDCNEDDNQGLRYLILRCWFAMKKYDAAALLLKKYHDDWGMDFIYGRLLLAIINGEEKKIKPLFHDALEYNKYVPAEILKDKHTPPIAFCDLDGFSLGSEEEAYDYWINNKVFLSDPQIKAFFAKIK